MCEYARVFAFGDGLGASGVMVPRGVAGAAGTRLLSWQGAGLCRACLLTLCEAYT